MGSVFNICDQDKDGHLRAHEMKHIGLQIGFKGTDKEWMEEYNALCVDHGADRSQGIDYQMFESLINDNGEGGCYCSESDLKAILAARADALGMKLSSCVAPAPAPKAKTVAPPKASSTRFDLIRKVFRAYDRDTDARLSET